MTSANVSQIPVGFMENTKAKSAAKSEGNSEDFMQMVTNSLQTQDKNTDKPAFVPAKSDGNEAVTAQQSFTTSDFSANKIPSETKTSEKALPQEVDEAIEKVDAFIEKVKEVLSENMDVSDEEIKEAMEVLGLDMIDLTLPENVSKLLGVLEGEENVSLILNDTVSNVLNDLEPHVLNLFETMGVESTPELKNFLADNDLAVTYEGLTKAPIDLGPNGEFKGVEVSPDEILPTQVFNTNPVISNRPDETVPLNEVPKDDALDTEVTPETVINVKAPIVSEDTKVKAELENFDFEEVKEMEVDKAVIETTETSSDSKDFQKNPNNGNSFKQIFEPTAVMNTSANVVSQATTNPTISFETVYEESTTSYVSINTEDIMEQIVTQTRTQVSENLTSMELELHPASLGKMYLQVTEENGSITAKIITQNHDVKAAMENQMAILKETWNQQGMKVNAVEISVGTREFEEQLDAQSNPAFENNSSKSSKSNEDEPNGRRSRNLNLNGLEDLPNDLTEEELLTASMMKDYGNSVNFTA